MNKVRLNVAQSLAPLGLACPRPPAKTRNSAERDKDPTPRYLIVSVRYEKPTDHTLVAYIRTHVFPEQALPSERGRAQIKNEEKKKEYNDNTRSKVGAAMQPGRATQRIRKR